MNSLKFLGIHFDEHLDWNDHILAVSKRINKGIFALRQVKQFLTIDCLKLLYFALIHSHILYCLEVWGNSRSIDKVFKLQKKAIRIVYRQNFRAHTEPLFKRAGILKLKDLYKLKILLFAYDYNKQSIPPSFHFIFDKPTYNYNIRQTFNLYCKRPRTSFSARAVAHEIVTLWNDCPENLKITPNRSTYKRTILQNFLNSYSENINCTNNDCRQCHP